MARYIDADKLIAEYDRVHIGAPGGARKLMVEAPTADVVPREEAENWYHLYHSIKAELKQEKMYHRATENLCDRYYIESQHAKQEVAREIFEEIYKSVASKIPMEIRPIFKDYGDFDGGFINGKRDALLDVLVLVAELKKKYTEGE